MFVYFPVYLLYKPAAGKVAVSHHLLKGTKNPNKQNLKTFSALFEYYYYYHHPE